MKTQVLNNSRMDNMMCTMCIMCCAMPKIKHDRTLLP